MTRTTTNKIKRHSHIYLFWSILNMLFSARPWTVHFETAVECATSNKNISSFFLQPFVSTGMFFNDTPLFNKPASQRRKQWYCLKHLLWTCHQKNAAKCTIFQVLQKWRQNNILLMSRVCSGQLSITWAINVILNHSAAEDQYSHDVSQFTSDLERAGAFTG